jgi:hypothetical protein
VIVYERGNPVVWSGEAEIGGRRIAARVVPYEGEIGPSGFRFDPIAPNVFVRAAAETVAAGPSDADLWRDAVLRAPAGPVLVGPGGAAEPVRGAFAAAAEGARAAGRAVYLLDPDSESLPAPPEDPFVALFCGLPEPSLWPRIQVCASRIRCGLVLPILPGWTAEPDRLRESVERAARAGACFVAGLVLPDDGETRRRVVAVRGLVESGSEESYFDRVHHGDWAAESARALARLDAESRRRGLAVRPPRPSGDGEPAGNAAASARLEELADAEESNEHRAALLRAAVRWLDERSRDLAPVVAEGNFRKIFPFGSDIAPEVERALGSLP